MKRMVPLLYASAVLIILLITLSAREDDTAGETVFLDDPASVSDTDMQSLYDELFAPDSVVDLSVDISYEQLGKLQKDYEYYKARNTRSPVYRIADSVTFTVNGKKYVLYDVGIRLKGTSSRCNFFNEMLGIYNLVNFKLCFNCTFDDVEDYRTDAHMWDSEEALQRRRNRTFATMSSMELKWNIAADATYVRNLYMQDLFHAYGVPAQNCALSTFRLGGKRMGVYRLFEPVDEDFIHRYFPEEDWGGDLYKVRCTAKCPATYLPINDYGICSKKKGVEYNFDLKTNLADNKHESIRRLLETVNQSGASREDFDRVADMDELALVQAINFAMGNQDDMRNNYNNHYLYFRKSDGKAVIIPYDNEILMGDTYLWSMYEAAMTTSSPYVEYNPRFGAPQENPLLRQTVLRGGYFTDLYTEHLRRIADSRWMTEEHYLPYYESARKRYGDGVVSKYSFLSTFKMKVDFSMNDGENGNMSIGEYMTAMRANIQRHLE